jgi:hypothetical protein
MTTKKNTINRSELEHLQIQRNMAYNINDMEEADRIQEIINNSEVE